MTIGRGYDLKYRSENEIVSDLTYSGIPIKKAKKISEGSKKSHCSASDFVRGNRELIGEITEVQQVKLFEKTYAKYVNDSARFYNKYKKTDSLPWEKLKQPLKDVLVDMKYQGRLEISMIPIFGKNDKKAVIDLIRKNMKLSSDESARQRIPYIERYMK